METLTQEQYSSRHKTLLAALLLSMWAPLATGLAVIMSDSTTQLADFTRRTVELLALLISWLVFRYVNRNKNLAPKQKARLEATAALFVSLALTCSAVAIFFLALSRLGRFEPGGNVYPGLIIAGLGLITNAWFWRRYSRLNNEQYNSIIDVQRQLYRAKAFADFCVIIALTAVAVNPHSPLTAHLDISGSLALSAYLLWSGFHTARKAVLLNSMDKSVTG